MSYCATPSAGACPCAGRPRRGISVPRSGSRPPVRADAPHLRHWAPQISLVFQPRVRWHASCFHSPFTMQAIETELETAEFEALWLQARCYEGCVSVGLVRVAIRRVDELRRLAAELARGRVVNGALFWRDPCTTAVAGRAAQHGRVDYPQERPDYPSLRWA